MGEIPPPRLLLLLIIDRKPLLRTTPTTQTPPLVTLEAPYWKELNKATRVAVKKHVALVLDNV